MDVLNLVTSRSSLVRGAGSLFAAGAILALLSAPSHAQVLLTLTPGDRDLPQGGTVTFTGTLTNNTAATIFIGAASSNTNPIAIGTDPTPFLSNGPASLTAGSSFTGDLFTATDNGATPKRYEGSFNINYGPSADDAFSNVIGANFGVVVTPAPAALPVFAVGGVLGLIATRRKKKNTEAS